MKTSSGATANSDESLRIGLELSGTLPIKVQIFPQASESAMERTYGEQWQSMGKDGELWGPLRCR